MNKEEKVGLIIISMIGLIFFKIVNDIQDKKIQFEYALNGQIYKSDSCQYKNGIGYCLKDNKYIEVNNYYETENK